jgi:hypothetical protein
MFFSQKFGQSYKKNKKMPKKRNLQKILFLNGRNRGKKEKTAYIF